MTENKKAARARYTLEFKQEALRLVESGQSIAAAARNVGIAEQTLFNWVKAQRQGRLSGIASSRTLSTEQMEISRLRAELAHVKMERDILGKATAYFAQGLKCSTPLSDSIGSSGRSACSAECWVSVWRVITNIWLAAGSRGRAVTSVTRLYWYTFAPSTPRAERLTAGRGFGENSSDRAFGWASSGCNN
jgi:transposase